MEIQSIFAWKSLPEAGFGKNVVIDAHRCSDSRMHRCHPSAGRSVLQDHSSETTAQRPFPDAWVLYARSVRRRAASFLRAIRKQPDRGTVDYPANWSRPAPTALLTIPNARFQAKHALLSDYP